MPLVIGDDSGFPKRCFDWINPKTHLRLKFCVVWLQYPAFVWRRPTPDPAPFETLQIEGVDAQVLRDLEIIDTIAWLSKGLSPGVAQGIGRAVEEGLNSIKKALPAELTLSE